MKYKQLSDEQWLQEQIKDKPLRQIAEELGCSYSGVLYASRRFNIEIPHRFSHRFSPTKSANIKKAFKKKYPNGSFGKLASNWKGGRRILNGYISIYSPDHPRAGTNKSVFEHILVAEMTLGRFLNKNEIVHHINHNKQDNRPENLQVTTRGEHVSNHFKEGKRTAVAELEITRLKALLDKHAIKY